MVMPGKQYYTRNPYIDTHIGKSIYMVHTTCTECLDATPRQRGSRAGPRTAPHAAASPCIDAFSMHSTRVFT